MKTGAVTTDLDERIAVLRQNLAALTEQAAGYSGAEDEDRGATRIAAIEQELAALIARRDGHGATKTPKS